MRTIKEIGLELKNYRIDNNIDINKLSKEMKVSSKIINLMENDEYEASNVRKRFLYKKYIERLGLKYLDYEADIKEQIPNIVEETINLSTDEILDEIRVKKKFKINKNLVSIIIVFIFLALLFTFTMYNFNNSVVDDQIINNTTLLSTTTLEPQNIVEPKVKELEVIRNSSNQIEVKLDSLENIEVLLKAKEDVYYDYALNNVIQEQGTIKKNEEKKINIKEGMNALINIGNLANVEIYINEYEITQKIEDVGTQNYISFSLESKKE